MKEEQIKILLIQQHKVKGNIKSDKVGIVIGGVLIVLSVVFGSIGRGFFLLSLEFILGLIVVIISGAQLETNENKLMEIELKLAEVPKKTLEKYEIVEVDS